MRSRSIVNNNNYYPDEICRQLYHTLQNNSEVFYSSYEEIGVSLNNASMGDDYIMFNYCPFCGHKIIYNEGKWREESKEEYLKRTELILIRESE
jgi:predicted RNA-binding Zn-ribbon protein involved in translation (DUF1610 family)